MTKLKGKISISGGKAAAVILFAALLFLMVFVAADARNHTDVENISIDIPEAVDFNSGWKSNGDPVDILSGHEFYDSIEITNVLPEDISGSGVLFFDSHGLSCRILADSEEIYSYGDDQSLDKSKVLSNVHCFVKLSDKYEGKTITCIFTAPYGKGVLPSFKYGSESGIIGALIKSDFFTVIFAGLLLFISLCLIVVYFIFKVKKIAFRNKCLFYLGAFILTSNVWIITDTQILQFITNEVTVVAYISYFSFSLLPVIFLMFIKDFCVYGRKFILGICTAYLTVLIALNISFLSGGLDIMNSLFVIHLLILTSFAAVVICIAVNIRKKKDGKTCRRLLHATFVLGAFSAIQMVSYYLNHDSSRNSVWFETGLLVFIIMLARIAIYKAMDFLELNAQNSIYKKLLYTDSLTQLGSRMSFDQYIDKLGKKLCCGDKIGFLVMDLNNLKETNDNLGHMNGDKLIKDMAQCINNAFGSDVQSFRIGGDEFVSVFVNSELTAEGARRELFSVIERFNLAYHSSVSAAVGCYESKIKGSSPKTDIMNVFKRADDNMYSIKAEMHKISGKIR